MLTIRQSSNNDILRRNSRAVFIVGHNSETILCVFLQTVYRVGKGSNVNVLCLRKDKQYSL